VTLSPVQVEQIIAQARADAPLETCGLIVARAGELHVLPMANALRSPVAYRMDDNELAQALIAYDEPLAIYHSHPHGPPGPSPTDIAQAYYPDSIYIIVSLATEPPSVRAFHIVQGVVTKVELQILV
jgi:proteasome lid subunit RPN8/RPN11